MRAGIKLLRGAKQAANQARAKLRRRKLRSQLEKEKPIKLEQKPAPPGRKSPKAVSANFHVTKGQNKSYLTKREAEKLYKELDDFLKDHRKAVKRPTSVHPGRKSRSDSAYGHRGPISGARARRISKKKK